MHALTLSAPCCTLCCPPQEISLEEYEAALAEKKRQLNKQAEAKSVDVASEFKGLKTFTKVQTEEQVN